jgi:hypothetical protein
LLALSRQQSPLPLHRLSHQHTPLADLAPQLPVHDPPQVLPKSEQQSPIAAQVASQ